MYVYMVPLTCQCVYGSGLVAFDAPVSKLSTTVTKYPRRPPYDEEETVVIQPAASTNI